MVTAYIVSYTLIGLILFALFCIAKAVTYKDYIKSFLIILIWPLTLTMVSVKMAITKDYGALEAFHIKIMKWVPVFCILYVGLFVYLIKVS